MAWQDEAQHLQAAGFSQVETQNIAYGIAQKMHAEGHSPEQFETFFGKPVEPETGHLSEYFNKQFAANMPNDDVVKEVGEHSGFDSRINAVKAGLQGSVIGLGMRHGLPDIEVEPKSLFSEGAPWYDRLLSGAAQTVADAPVMAGGFVAGNLPGAFALPAGMRAAMVQSYQQGGIHSFGDFWNVATKTAEEAAKGYATGIAAGVGKAAGIGLAAESGPLAQATIPFASELTAMTTAGAALDGHMPEPKDFLDNAILMGGLHFAGVMPKLYKTFADTGMHPQDVAAAAMADPVLKQQMLGMEHDTPNVLSPIKEPSVTHSEFVIVGDKLIPAHEAAAQGEFQINGTPAEFIRDTEARFTPEARMQAARAHDPAAFRAIDQMSADVRDANKEMKVLLEQEDHFRAQGVKNDSDYQSHINRVNRMEQIDRRMDRIKGNAEIKERVAKAFEQGQTTLKNNTKDRLRNSVLSFPDMESAKVNPEYNPEFTSQEDHNPLVSNETKLELMHDDVFPKLLGDENTPFTRDDALASALQKYPELAKVLAPELVHETTAPLTAEETAAGKTPESTLRIGPRVAAAREQTSLDTMIRDYYNDLHFLKVVGDSTKKSVGEFPINADAYKLALKSRDAEKRARLMIGSLKENGSDQWGVWKYGTDKKVSDSLYSVLKPVKDSIDDFRRYIIYAHAYDLNVAREKTGVNQEEAKAFLDANRGRFEEHAKNVVKWNNAVLEYAKDGGLLTEENFNNLVNDYKNYVPTNRLTQDLKAKGSPYRKKTIYDRKGSELPFLDPITAMMEKAINLTKQVEENGSKKALVLQNELRPDGEKIGKVRSGEEGKAIQSNEIEYLDNGQRKVFTVDVGDKFVNDGIAGALNKIDYDPGVAKLLGPLYSVAKGAATITRTTAVASADFLVRHIIRSELFSGLVSDIPIVPFVDTLRNIGKVMGQNSPEYLEALKHGAFDGVIGDFTKEYLKSGVYNMVDKQGMLGTTHNAIKNIFSLTHAGIRVAEEAKRLAIYEKALKENPEATFGEKLEAGWQARRGTVDGLQIGARMRGMSAITAFMHFEVQGLGRGVEAWKNNPQAMAFRSSLITAASIALWYAGKDDEGIQILPDYQKNLFWNIRVGSEIVKIAKPWEQGLIFGSLPERIMDLHFKNNPRALNGFGQVLADMIPIKPPSIYSQYQALHYNLDTMSDRQIIPDFLMKQAPESRYLSYTSDVAKGVAGALSHVPGSGFLNLNAPVMVDHAIRMFLGQPGQLAVRAIDTVLQKSNITPPGTQSEKEWADIPFLGGFISRHPTYNAQPIKDFKEAFGEASKNFNTYNAYKKAGDFEKAAQFQQEHPEVLNFSSMQQANAAMAGWNSMIQKTNMIPNDVMSPADKKQSLENLYRTMVTTAKTKLDEMDEVRENNK